MHAILLGEDLMNRTTIMLPHTLKARALQHPKKRGAYSDALLDDDSVFAGPVPKDVARNQDRYLYGFVR